MTKVINLFAGPGAGKSTTAADLFRLMKNRGVKCELVTEYAKDLAYEGAPLDNQLYVLAKQDSRQRRLVGKVDYVITDSPLPLSLVYASGFWDNNDFRRLVWGMFRQYDNVCFRIVRVKPYAAYGRSQTEAEARQLDDVIYRIATTAAVGKLGTVNGDDRAAPLIMKALGL